MITNFNHIIHDFDIFIQASYILLFFFSQFNITTYYLIYRYTTQMVPRGPDPFHLWEFPYFWPLLSQLLLIHLQSSIILEIALFWNLVFTKEQIKEYIYNLHEKQCSCQETHPFLSFGNQTPNAHFLCIYVIKVYLTAIMCSNKPLTVHICTISVRTTPFFSFHLGFWLSSSISIFSFGS